MCVKQSAKEIAPWSSSRNPPNGGDGWTERGTSEGNRRSRKGRERDGRAERGAGGDRRPPVAEPRAIALPHTF